MASDLLALLDTLDGLHRAAGPGAWRMDPTGTSHQRAIRDASAEAVAICYCGKAHAVDIAKGITALHNAYPRLTAALRAALTPVMEGEREAREALAAHDERMKDQWSWKRAENPDVEIHLRTALNLLTAEHAKAADIDDRHQSQIADYQQEVARLRAALDAERAKGRA